ncbi:hypothetical protein U1701_11030 [Sphingomonas sp. PB2P19]|uniref:hypothetical protein n=1 Tax=Sphingomonas rhamnosi TaxID=3096156 RepID=UPI002FCBC420
MKQRTRPQSYDELIAGRYGIGPASKTGNGRKGPRDVAELYAGHYAQCAPKPAKPKAAVETLWVSADDDLRQRYRTKARMFSDDIAPAAPQPIPNGTVTPSPVSPAPPPSEEDRAREEEKLDLFAEPLPNGAPPPEPQPVPPPHQSPPYQSPPAPPPAPQPLAAAKSLTGSNDFFMADMQSILTGQKAYDATTRTMVPRSEFPHPAEARNDSPAAPASQPAPQVPAPGAGHEIFERIAQSMEYAGAYDLGSVEIENRFAQFDRERDGTAPPTAPPTTAPAAAPAPSYGAAAAPAVVLPPIPPTPAPPPVDAFRDDLRDMLARPQPVAPPAPPPPADPMAAAAPHHDDEVFFPDPDTLKPGMLAPPRPPLGAPAVPAAATAQSLPESSIARPFYGSGEHMRAGHGLYEKQLEVGPPPGLLLSYGDLIAMPDLYASVDEMMQQPLAKLQRVKDLLDKDLAQALGTAAKGATDDEWEAATDQRYLKLAADNFAHFAPTVLFAGKIYSTRIASPNDHKRLWDQHHKRAMAAARTPEALPWRNASPRNWPVTINAFGDHYLTDAFAGGHLFNKAEALSLFMSNFYANGKPTSATETFLNRVAHVAWHGDLPAKFGKLEPVAGIIGDLGHPDINSPGMFYEVLKGIAKQEPMMVANLAVKTVHDKYNAEGIAVVNGFGDGWTLTGDGHLTAATLTKMQAAVEQSAADIADPAIQQPGFNPDTFCARVWKHVPQLTAPSADAVRATLTAWFTPGSPELTSAAAKVIYDQTDFLIKELKARNKLRDAT